jgi:hypothetical protein
MTNAVDGYRRQRDQKVGVDEVERKKVTDPWEVKKLQVAARYGSVRLTRQLRDG